MVMRLKNMDLSDKRLEAKRLYILKDLTASDVSKLIDISEKTIGVWVKKQNWKADKDKRRKELLENDMDNDAFKIKVINEFGAYLKQQRPNLSKNIDEAINDYLNS
jgi:uncharacterized protein YjcR